MSKLLMAKNELLLSEMLIMNKIFKSEAYEDDKKMPL